MTYLTPEERRRMHAIRLAASRPRSRARVAIHQGSLPQAAWSRSAITGALFALALGGAVALRQFLPPLASELASWVEWILPRVY